MMVRKSILLNQSGLKINPVQELTGTQCIYNSFLVYRGCPGQLARTSINPTGPEVNDHVSLHWSSYEQPQGSNLRPQRKQTS